MVALMIMLALYVMTENRIFDAIKIHPDLGGRKERNICMM